MIYGINSSLFLIKLISIIPLLPLIHLFLLLLLYKIVNTFYKKNDIKRLI